MSTPLSRARKELQRARARLMWASAALAARKSPPVFGVRGGEMQLCKAARRYTEAVQKFREASGLADDHKDHEESA